MAAIEGEITIAAGARDLIPTGFSLAIPIGYEGQVRPRSGIALRHGIVVPNAPGTIDSDYRGEVKVILLNAGGDPFVIKRGDRIAQLVIAPVVQSVFDEVTELDETERGDGGFGHSGTRSGGVDS
jgi:dUTP pyrophosphatase